jgi:hypothetical protein
VATGQHSHNTVPCHQLGKCFISFLHGGTPKMIFHTPRTTKYKNVHRPENTGSGECYSVPAKLISSNFVLKSCYISQLTLQKLQHISKDPGNSCIISKYITNSGCESLSYITKSVTENRLTWIHKIIFYFTKLHIFVVYFNFVEK